MISGKYPLVEQHEKGSYHKKKDLEHLRENIEFNWNENIAKFLLRYKEKDLYTERMEKTDVVYQS